MADELKLRPTGKTVVLVEMEGTTGPFEFHVHDLDTTLAVLQLLVERAGPDLAVDGYDAEEEKHIRSFLTRGE